MASILSTIFYPREVEQPFVAHPICTTDQGPTRSGLSTSLGPKAIPHTPLHRNFPVAMRTRRFSFLALGDDAQEAAGEVDRPARPLFTLRRLQTTPSQITSHPTYGYNQARLARRI